MVSNSPYYQSATKSQLSLSSDTSSTLSIHMSAFPLVPSSPSSSSFGSLSPRLSPNFDGSWLDIESDDEDAAPIARRLTTSRSRSKSSATRDSPPRSSGFTFRDLTSRGSASLRKLTSLMTR
ncbi:hypothetical protein H4R19_006533 [Coemansia spiralis]|nr:hypothetical protein H4R19_006533 [Coemansia spiralis]